MKVGIIGASGKLGKYMIEECLEKGYEVVGVCREQSVIKLEEYKSKIDIVPGKTNDSEVIQRAINDCDAVLCVLVPWGVQDYSSGTASAVLKHSKEKARLIFSCGWHITKDGKDKYDFVIKYIVPIFAFLAKLIRFADITDQEKACNLIFNSQKDWTVVRCSDIEEGPSEGLPVWSEYVGDQVLKRNKTRRIDFAKFMVHAIENNQLIQKAPAISGKEIN